MKNTRSLLGVGTWIASGSTVVTELIDQLGFDWLLFDLEHGTMSDKDVLKNLQVVRNARVIVRIGEFSPSLIARVLDWGAAGIMMPHVNSAEEAERVVEAMRYPPYGNRGYSGSARCFGYGAQAPPDTVSFPAPLFMAQIENEIGVRNVDEIAQVPGVDVLFVGPADLKLDYCISGKTSEEFEEALQKVALVAKARAKQSGILIRNHSDLKKLQDYGYTAIAAGSDLGVLRQSYVELTKLYL